MREGFQNIGCRFEGGNRGDNYPGAFRRLSIIAAIFPLPLTAVAAAVALEVAIVFAVRTTVTVLYDTVVPCSFFSLLKH
jgi:hypothetical protein